MGAVMVRKLLHRGKLRGMLLPDVSDAEMAGKVRMLLRSDLDHELVCQAARDRILTLAREKELLVAAVRRVLVACEEYASRGELIWISPGQTAIENLKNVLEDVADGQEA